jgi:hypothetical protein
MVLNLDTLPPALRGYIVELQDQVRMFSERAAVRAAESFDLRAEVEQLKKEKEKCSGSEQSAAQPQ